MNSKNALESWKRADADARVAESRLLAAWELYEKKLVAAPAEDLLREVTGLRARANEQLWLAMITLTSAATEQRISSQRGDTRSP